MVQRSNPHEAQTGVTLFQVCQEFWQAKPWQVLSDDQLFAVRDPQTQILLYCAVLGQAGQVQGLAVFPGAEGLSSYDLFQAQHASSHTPSVFYSMRVVVFSVEHASAPTESDIRFLSEQGMPGPEPSVWPRLRSFEPGYEPGLPSAEECRWLELAVHGTLTLIRAIQKQELQWPSSQDHLWVLGWKSGTREWVVQKEALSREAEAPRVPEVDELRLQRLKNQAQRSGVWEGMCFWLRVPVQEGEDKSFYPLVAVWVDAETGMIIHHEMTKPEQGTGVLHTSLLRAMEQSRTIPDQVHVTSRATVLILRPVTRPLGIVLTDVGDLPAVQDAVQWLQSSMLQELHGHTPKPEASEEEDLLEQLEQANHELLALFEAWLAEQGLHQNTRVRHLRTIDLFLNSFLMDIGPLAPDDGMFKVEEFFGQWVHKAVPWLSQPGIQGMIPGLKKFAVFLHEQGLMAQDDLQDFLALVKSNRQRWVGQ